MTQVMNQVMNQVKSQTETNESILPGMVQRVMKELLATPAVKEAILTNVRDINPDNAKGLANILLWSDPGFSLSMVGVVPGMINYLIEFMLELGRQFDGMPMPLLKDFLKQLGVGLDLERAAEFPKVFGPFLDHVLWNDAVWIDGVLDGCVAVTNATTRTMDSVLGKLGSHLENSDGSNRNISLDQASLGAMVNSTLKLLNEALEKDPDLLKQAMSGVDGKEFARTANHIFNIVIDSIVPISKWMVGAVVGRVKRKFSRKPSKSPVAGLASS